MVELDGPVGGGRGCDKWPGAEKVRRKFESLTWGENVRRPDAGSSHVRCLLRVATLDCGVW